MNSLDIREYPTEKLKLILLATSRIFWSKSDIFSDLCIKRSAWLLRSFPYKNFGRRLRLRRWEKGKSSSKNPINYNYLVTSSMTSPSWIIPHMKALDLKFCIASRLSLATTWWRSRAIRKISKNGFSATPSGRILMIYTLKVHKYYCDSDDVCIMTFWGQKRSNVGHNRKIRV